MTPTTDDFPNHDKPACRAAVLTPAGRGAIATVLLRGAGALAVIEACFRPATKRHGSSLSCGRIVFGRWISIPGTAAADTVLSGDTGEELVVCQCDQETFEIHCHGGTSAVSAIMGSLTNLGCQEVPWSQLVGGCQLVRAARAALAEATTEYAASVLLAQANGALSRAITDRINEIEKGEIPVARQGLNALIGTYHYGGHLIRPWKVVVAGPPNVGKSSLINALVGFERTIVYDEPGTTRDVVTAQTAMEGWPVELSDTAGLRTSGNQIEMAGVMRAKDRMLAADLCLLVCDIRDSLQNKHHQLLDQFPSAIVAWNKSDLVAGHTQPAGLATSAITGYGIGRLIKSIVRGLVPVPPKPAQAVVFELGQRTRLEQAVQALDGNADENNADLAVEILREMLN